MQPSFARGILRQELALEAIGKSVNELFTDQTITAIPIKIGERLVALQFNRALKTQNYVRQKQDGSWSDFYYRARPEVPFSKFLDSIYKDTGDKYIAPPEIQKTRQVEGLGFHIDHYVKFEFQTVPIRIWHALENPAVAQFALATAPEHVAALIHKGNSAEERLAAANSLPLSEPIHLPEGSVLAFSATHYVNSTDPTNIMSVSTPHNFTRVDTTKMRRAQTASIPISDPLSELSDSTVAQMLVARDLA